MYRGIGVMTGTSMDGIDMASCVFRETETGWEHELEVAETHPFDDKWYARLSCLDTQSAETYAKTNVYFGHVLGRAVAGFIEKHSLKPQFVASHGQTIFHQPDKSFTAQVGDGESMVAYLPCPLVTNFRNKDIALQGQGAPLVPFGEANLFPDTSLFLNLGGIANLTYLGQAFDVCPCNMALNWLVQSRFPKLRFDQDGQLAEAGNLDPHLFGALERLGYYRKSPPKSLGAEWFERDFLPILVNCESPVEDQLHTVVRHIATRIATAARSWSLEKETMLVTGGGAFNQYLMQVLSQGLKPMGIEIVSDTAQELIAFKEALIFAYLGLMTLLGKPNTLSSATGAKKNVLGGSIHLPAGGYPSIRLLD